MALQGKNTREGLNWWGHGTQRIMDYGDPSPKENQELIRGSRTAQERAATYQDFGKLQTCEGCFSTF